MLLRRHRLTRRRLALIAVAWAVVIVGSLAVASFEVRRGNLRELKSVFSDWKTPVAARTIVVFAPHCDDETIGAGGMLRQAARRGDKVWVVLMTNGDGFKAAAVLDNRSLKVSADYFVEFGFRRQLETFCALEKLGIPRDRVITLGYPDRGLKPMWVSNWNALYTSLYTRDAYSPYSNSYTPYAPYRGRQVLADVKRLLGELNPDEVYAPHPNDQHPDHWATSAFVTAALHELGWLRKKRVGLYLVHRGDWPVPQGIHKNQRLAPPAKLTDLDTNWYPLELEEESVRDKELAVREFRSQTAGVRRFLRSFVRQNELFGTRSAESRMAHVSAINVDGLVEDWDGIEPSVLDPADDGLVTHARPSADLTSVYAAKDSKQLYFRLSVRGLIKRGTTYELWVHPLDSDEGTTRIVLRKGRELPAGWKAAFGRRDIEFSCAVDQWGGKPIMVAASTKTRWYKLVRYEVDRSAYRILAP
ncbi:MAG: PIG-L family deacetylase [Armatimonadetes bacterium]|nr:PIG-L family deacetylase [Armatimonadota bacterium]